MKTTEFCYWLQGFFELQGDTPTQALTPMQVNVIKNHLNMVFIHDIDPRYPNEQQKTLNDAHNPNPLNVPYWLDPQSNARC